MCYGLLMRFVLPLFLLIALMCSAGCGKKAENAVEDPFAMDFRCAACAHEFTLEYAAVKKMKKTGTAVVPEGELLQVTCPECNELKARDADPRLWPAESAK